MDAASLFDVKAGLALTFTKVGKIVLWQKTGIPMGTQLWLYFWLTCTVSHMTRISKVTRALAASSHTWVSGVSTHSGYA